MRDLIKRLLDRAGLDLAGHDLRRTFATLVRKSSGDEYLGHAVIARQDTRELVAATSIWRRSS